MVEIAAINKYQDFLVFHYIVRLLKTVLMQIGKNEPAVAEAKAGR